MNKQKICIISGSRADYSLLKNLMHLLHDDTMFVLDIVVTGPHLSPIWGEETYKDIERDGFKISGKIETLLSSDTFIGTAKSLGLGILGFTDYFSINKPDLIIILGDRFEILAAAQAAYCMKIPVAHLHGGEVTSGAMDDYFRHALTKLSHIHFVAHKEYAQRLIRMGENPENIHIVGALGIDQINKVKYYTRNEFADIIHADLSKDYFLVGYHPSTLECLEPKHEATVAKNIFLALEEYKNYNLLVTLANADAGGYTINKVWHELAEKHPERLMLFNHLGSEKYLNAVEHSALVIGNSSSGILEVPYFKKATINVGNRQKGRVQPSSVINCQSDVNSLRQSVTLAFDKKWHNKNVIGCESIYGEPGTVALTILQQLKSICLDKMNYKVFYDVA